MTRPIRADISGGVALAIPDTPPIDLLAGELLPALDALGRVLEAAAAGHLDMLLGDLRLRDVSLSSEPLRVRILLTGFHEKATLVKG